MLQKRFCEVFVKPTKNQITDRALAERFPAIQKDHSANAVKGTPVSDSPRCSFFQKGFLGQLAQQRSSRRRSIWEYSRWLAVMTGNPQSFKFKPMSGPIGLIDFGDLYLTQSNVMKRTSVFDQQPDSSPWRRIVLKQFSNVKNESVWIAWRFKSISEVTHAICR